MAVLGPPVTLLLAQSAREVPTSRTGREWAFEPKFDFCPWFVADG